MFGAIGAARGRIAIAGSAFDFLQTTNKSQRMMSTLRILLTCSMPVATTVHPASDFHEAAVGGI